MKYEWYQPAGFLNCNRAIDWLHGSHSPTSWPVEIHLGACSLAEMPLYWLLITREAGEVFPLLRLNGTGSEPTRLPWLSMPWHQNTRWRTRRQREALLRTPTQWILVNASRGICLEEDANVSYQSFCFQMMNLLWIYLGRPVTAR